MDIYFEKMCSNKENNFKQTIKRNLFLACTNKFIQIFLKKAIGFVLYTIFKNVNVNTNFFSSQYDFFYRLLNNSYF